MKTAILILSIIANAYCALSQAKITEHVYQLDSTTIATSASIDDFKIMIGQWSGSGLGGTCEEVWLKPVAGAMHGIFRIVDGNTLLFTEYMSIINDSIGYVLKIKHFSPQFVGWELQDQSVDFRYIKSEANTLYFSGITFVLESDHKLLIYLAFKQKDKSYKEEKFIFTKD